MVKINQVEIRLQRFLLLVLLISGITGKAQDLHLTQYYTSNLSLNPAWTGFYKGDIRLAANYRNQWWQLYAPIQTNMFSLEKKITKHAGEFGLGFILMNDYSSVFKLHTDKVFFSGSFQKKLNKHLLRVGVQAGAVLKKTDLGSMPEQWNYTTGSFDRSLSTGEAAFSTQKFFSDFNAGVAWSTLIRKSRISAGYGLFHITRPDESLITDARKLPFRHSANIMLTHPLNSTLALVPHILYMRTAKATDFIGGVNVKKQLNDVSGVFGGASYRGSQVNSDAAIATAGFSYRRFEFGMSMDFNVSQLSSGVKNKTALELSLIYTTPSRTVDKVTIPCDRY
jgi:type IX secretion system PorP/SprF family membrane protein